jgi:hypothetical protein
MESPITGHLPPRSMGLLGVARANTAVGVSPETFLLLLLLVAHLPGDMLALESALKPLADALEDIVQELQVGGGDPVRRQARPIKGGLEGSMTPQSGRSAVSLQGI